MLLFFALLAKLGEMEICWSMEMGVERGSVKDKV
jgi:hypothetical protein